MRSHKHISYPTLTASTISQQDYSKLYLILTFKLSPTL
jgi:hypothetical protein